jgi:hypothetical protein
MYIIVSIVNNKYSEDFFAQGCVVALPMLCLFRRRTDGARFVVASVEAQQPLVVVKKV